MLEDKEIADGSQYAHFYCVTVNRHLRNSLSLCGMVVSSPARGMLRMPFRRKAIGTADRRISPDADGKFGEMLLVRGQRQCFHIPGQGGKCGIPVHTKTGQALDSGIYPLTVGGDACRNRRAGNWRVRIIPAASETLGAVLAVTVAVTIIPV